jgi:DNA mismatch repair ATPase MutS
MPARRIVNSLRKRAKGGAPAMPTAPRIQSTPLTGKFLITLRIPEISLVPDLISTDTATFVSCGLYDPSLSLNMTEKVVGNDVSAASKLLVMITGANKGGKSTLLRAIGLAQLMAQSGSGMFVAAGSLRIGLSIRLFTHFKREEDVQMKSGKFDEELSRMSRIIDETVPNSMVLLNESLSSTTEREGSEIAGQIVLALMKANARVFYVTHMFTLAHGLYKDGYREALFLRAERRDDGERTFRFQEGEPLATSYGEDLYRQIFETSTIS